MAKARKKPSMPMPFDGGSARRFAVPAAHLTSVSNSEGQVVRGPGAPGMVSVKGARAAQPSKLLPVAGDANGRKQRRIIHPLDAMEKSGALNPWQAGAGYKLLDAWEATTCGPGRDLADPRVDSTPDPDARTTALIVKQARFADYRKHMPNESRRVVEHVVLNGRYLRCGLARDGHDMAVMLEQLRIALDMLADYLGLR